MSNFFYVVERIDHAITLIKINTDWKQVAKYCFVNGDERIVIINSSYKLRGKNGMVFI